MRKWMPFQKLSKGGEQMRVLLLTVMPPSESMNAGEVLEVDLDQVVDLQAVAHEVLDGLDRQGGAAERVGGVDLAAAVAGDVGPGVARDRQLAHAAEAGVDDHDRVGARRPDGGPVARVAGAGVGAEHQDLRPAGACSALGEGVLGIGRQPSWICALTRKSTSESSSQPPTASASHLRTRPGVIGLRSRGSSGSLPGDPAEPAPQGVEVAAARERPLARAVDLVLRRGRILVGHRPLYIVRPCRPGE